MTIPDYERTYEFHERANEYDMSVGSRCLLVVLKKLEDNETKYGAPYCPCSNNHNADTICPCKYMREKQECCCGLYVKKEEEAE